MQQLNNRRRRRRRPTGIPRFGPESIALEIGLLRMSLDVQREIERKEEKNKQK